VREKYRKNVLVEDREGFLCRFASKNHKPPRRTSVGAVSCIDLKERCVRQSREKWLRVGAKGPVGETDGIAEKEI